MEVFFGGVSTFSPYLAREATTCSLLSPSWLISFVMFLYNNFYIILCIRDKYKVT